MDIINFNLFDAGFCCLPIHFLIFEFCFGINSSYLETVWSFSVLLLWFVRQDWDCSCLGLIVPTVEARSFLVQCLMSYECFHFAWWKQSLFQALCEHPASNTFRLFFTPVLVVSLHIYDDQYSAAWFRGPSANLQSSLSMLLTHFPTDILYHTL